MNDLKEKMEIRKISSNDQYKELESILLKEKIWTSEVLITIEDDLKNFFDWYIVNDSSAIMIGKVLNPTPIFIHGKIDYYKIKNIIKNFKSIKLQCSIIPNELNNDYNIKEKFEMVKMNFQKFNRNNQYNIELTPTLLSKDDIKDAFQLYIENGGKPEEFDIYEFVNGVYYGIKKQNKLISMAGTQIRSIKYKTVVIGNVITKPSERGKGYATLCLSYLIKKLKEKFETITLNADKKDKNAINLYERIGFKKCNDYFELFIEKKEH